MPLLDAYTSIQNAQPDDIAIVGLACRFPGDADSPSKLWQMLVEGRSAWSEVPSQKWNHAAHYHPSSERAASTFIRGGHFLQDNGKRFDATFFNITRTEALSMDLQQRIVMENVYEALENAGLRLEDVRGSKTSVFAGAFTDDTRAILNEDPDILLKYKPTGTSNSIISNRVSWFYDFRGCSLTLDTACSSSLVAFHLACNDLRQGSSDMSIVCGVNVIESPETMYRMSNLGFLSPDGKCFSFDSRANGYSRGEGVGTIILKPVRAALRDGDLIRAVVRGTGVNQDGRGTGGITLPNKQAQEELIRHVYRSFDLDLNATGFVEAHATGTPAGDPLEAAAIASAWQKRPANPPLYVGAGKTNHGHLEGASGVAAVIKTVLALEEAVIPPNINFEKVNPRIPCDRWKIKFPLALTPWPDAPLRRASLNSFGFGGTNAHVVLDDSSSYLRERRLIGSHKTKGPSQTEKGVARRGYRVFVWSAQDEEGIKRALSTFSEHLKDHVTSEEQDSYLDDLSYTLSERRSRLAWRIAVAAETVAELVEKISDPTTKSLAIRPGPTTPSLGYVFTGQGAQWHAMGRELLEYAVFKDSVTAATAYLSSLGSPFDVLDELTKPAESSKINEPFISQTLCTVLQVALVDTLSAWGISPVRVVGHSSGEIGAAYAAGALGRESAWRVAYFRGLVSSKPAKAKGTMLAVGASTADMEPYIDKVNKELPDGELVVACYNSPRSITCSGDEAKINRLKELADADSIFARKLKVSNAYHSSHMQAVADEYRSLMGSLTSGQANGQILVFSSVTGELISAAAMSSPDYWVDNLVSPVKFDQALLAMSTSAVVKTKLKLGGGAELPVTQIIEIGPHAALQSAVRGTVLADPNLKAIRYLSLLSRNAHATQTTLSAVGALAASGYPVDLCAANQSPTRQPQILASLPSYAFNHAQEHWTESRRSRAWRFRGHARHDVLGARAADWDAAQPRWRNVLRVAELPWLAEHRVTGGIVVPGVTYTIMAAEGVRELCADEGKAVRAFRLRDVAISRALQVAEDGEDGAGATETMLAMRRLPESAVGDSGTWWEWRVSSFSPGEGSWLEHARGQVGAELADSLTGPIDAGREAREREVAFKNMLEASEAGCGGARDLERQYAELERVGLEFGPLFRNLTDVKTAEATGKVGQALGTLRVPDIASCMPAGALADHIIQPPVFDSMIHMFLFAFQASVGAGPLTEPLVPVAIRSLWISADMETAPGAQFKCHSSAQLASHKRYGADITVWSEESRDVKIVLRGLEAVPLQESSADADQRQICFNMEWKPDMELMSNSEIQCCLREAVAPLEERDGDNLQRVKDLQLAAAVYITEAVEELEKNPLPSTIELEPHKGKYLSWLRLQASKFANGALIHQTPDWAAIKASSPRRAAFLEQLSSSGPEGALTTRMGAAVVPVLRGAADALQLMFGQDDLLEQYYRHILGTDKVHALLRAYLALHSHRRADLRVCEVGAGTGGTTAAVLEALCPGGARAKGASRLLRYTYTDVSAGFFDKAAAKFGKWRGLMEFRVLDVERGAAEQGFAEGAYDVVVAANVVHATADLSATLANVRALLRPGGVLLLQEITQPEFVAGPLCFGQLPGWWLSTEERRPWGPLLSEEGWREVLGANGFGADVLTLSDSLSADLHAQSLVVATKPEAREEVEGEALGKVFVVTTAAPSQEEKGLADAIAAEVKKDTSLADVAVVAFSELPQHGLKDVCCVVAMEAYAPFLASQFSGEEFEILRQLVTTAGSLLWVTGDPYEKPDMALVTGLMRTLRWERDLDGSDLVTLGLEDVENSTAAALARHVAAVYKRHFVAHRDRHAEYTVQSNRICTNRLVEAPVANSFIGSRCSAPVPQPQEFGEAKSSRAVMLSTSSPGRLDKLHFVDWPDYTAPLPDDQIEVEIKATGLNFRDVMVAMGEVAAATFGHEGAGVVTKVGAGVSDVQPGDRMLVLSALHGTFQTHTRTPRDIAAKIPADMSFETAAGMPVIFSTAYYCLAEVARLRAGETCLIHAAAGGVGQAAIQIAQNMGAEVFATVSSPEKRQLLVDEYGVPADHIFSSRDLSFAAGVMRMTAGRGVDVILNSLAGEALRASWDCIATFGRFIEIGKRDIFANGRLDMLPFSRSVMFAACDLYTITKLDTKTTSRILAKIIDMWQSGEIRAAQPQTVYSFAQIEDAFRLLQAGKHMGKVVLTAGDRDVVKVIPQPPVPTRLRPDATYILSGGLGGLGRSIARWMAHHGARNLVFLSRSGDASDAAKELLQDLRRSGVKAVALSCDISREEALVNALKGCKDQGFPPFAGVIQGAMQLKDSAFEFMPHDSYTAALAPKVAGTWNLHNHLPPSLDFFITLSSICGLVGNRGQSNYAAGNTFQDALAHHRRAHGLPASTLDLGNILSVGYIAENQATLNANPTFFFAHDGVREAEFLALVEQHVDAQRAAAAPPQVAIGLATSADFRGRGLPEPTFMQTPLFAQLRSQGVGVGAASAAPDADDVSVQSALRWADGADAAAALVVAALVRRLCRTMGLRAEDVDVARPIHAYGVDSLVAMEFRNYVGHDMGADVAVLDIMGNRSIEALSVEIMEKIQDSIADQLFSTDVPWFVDEVPPLQPAMRQLLTEYAGVPAEEVEARVLQARNEAWRALLHSGAPPSSLHATDLVPGLIAAGHTLFADAATTAPLFLPGVDFLAAGPSSPLAPLAASVDVVHASMFLHCFDRPAQRRAAARIAALLVPRRGSMVVGRQGGVAVGCGPREEEYALLAGIH
ncbi:putative lovastatin nonaketide synthase protein [Neofusicoccum parvum]|uniref:Lovastatin nonaketide synthase protein n=1 Tax=Neofusicoccum parvum TaxID=310453 RepID=A0ACB5SKC3_9PEZI|nr:putative lovastatin nonaketide synthase protein [Neofusicoccum parvum]